MTPRVLIFNFFGGLMDRGIPLYTRDLAECMRRIGYEPVELRCPRLLRGSPRFVRNALFVLCEQLLMPLARVWLRAPVAIYPYNSVSIVDAALGRAILVIHDLISNQQKRTSPAARYVRLTQAIHRRLGRPICAASSHTLIQLRRMRSFAASPLQLWSNPFYAFEQELTQRRRAHRDGRREPTRVLLCSGMGHNKDYAGALRLFRRSDVLRNAQLRIVGFNGDAGLARRRIARLAPDVRHRIVILPRLTLPELVDEYLGCDVVWVHSRKEGFGRSLIESRLCGKPTVASSILAFFRLRGPGVHLYRDATFDAAVSRALASGTATRLDIADYHAELEAAVQEVLEPGPTSAALLGEP